MGCAVLRRVVPRYRRVATQRGTTRCNAGPLSGRPAPYRPVSLMLSYFSARSKCVGGAHGLLLRRPKDGANKKGGVQTSGKEMRHSIRVAFKGSHGEKGLKVYTLPATPPRRCRRLREGRAFRAEFAFVCWTVHSARQLHHRPEDGAAPPHQAQEDGPWRLSWAKPAPVRRRGRLRRLPAGAVYDGAPPVIAIDAAAGAAAKAATPDSAEVGLLVCLSAAESESGRLSSGSRLTGTPSPRATPLAPALGSVAHGPTVREQRQPS